MVTTDEDDDGPPMAPPEIPDRGSRTRSQPQPYYHHNLNPQPAATLLHSITTTTTAAASCKVPSSPVPSLPLSSFYPLQQQQLPSTPPHFLSSLAQPFPFPPGPAAYYNKYYNNYILRDQHLMMPFPFGLALAGVPFAFTPSPINVSPTSFTIPTSVNTDSSATTTSINVPQQPQTSLDSDNPLIGNTNSNFDEIDPDRSRSSASSVTYLPRIDEVIEDVDPNSVVVPFRVLVDATINTELTHTDILYTDRDDLVGGTLQKASPERLLLLSPTLISAKSPENNTHILSGESNNGNNEARVDVIKSPRYTKVEASDGSEASDNEEESRIQGVDSLETIAIDGQQEEDGSPDKGFCGVM